MNDVNTYVREVKSVAIVGTGALGASWVTLALARGLSVVASDPAPEAEQRLLEAVRRDLPSTTVNVDELQFSDDVRSAVHNVDLVIEAGPERLETKQQLFGTMDSAASPETLLTSSTSGISPSLLQEACHRHPERVLVAHPFNPPHIMPLVEVVGGRRTNPAAIDAAMAAFRNLGRKPIHIKHELPGHVANRLQAALWREAYHLVGTGVVTAQEIDIAIANGPGLRWALLGPFATQHLSGGSGGFSHVCEHLGPATEQWWEDLGTPTLTSDLVKRLVASVDQEFEGRNVSEIRRCRDQLLQELMRLKSEWGLDDEVEA